MKRIETKITALSKSLNSPGYFTVVLSDINSDKKLPIIISEYTANIIIRKMDPNNFNSKPVTIDLIKKITDTYQIDIQAVLISDVFENNFYSRIITSNSLEEIEMESNVGDALVISLTYNCPIFINEYVMDKYGVFVDDIITPKLPPIKIDKNDSIDSLNEMLNQALLEEDYTKAIELRDRINNLKNIEI
jgi:bifunctional DNase/RNase